MELLHQKIFFTTSERERERGVYKTITVMGALKPVDIVVLLVFLMHSVDTVYNAPARGPHPCSVAELSLRRNNAEVLDDALYITGKFLVSISYCIMCP